MARFAGNAGVQEWERGIAVSRARYFQLSIARMTVQASGGDRKIERRRDAVLKPRSHVIAAIGGVPINGHLIPVVVRVVEIGSAPITRANVVLKEPPTMEATDFKFPWTVKLEPHLSVLHRNPIFHRR